MRQEFKPKESSAIQDLQEQLAAAQGAIDFLMSAAGSEELSDDDTSTNTSTTTSTTAKA